MYQTKETRNTNLKVKNCLDLIRRIIILQPKRSANFSSQIAKYYFSAGLRSDDPA